MIRSRCLGGARLVDPSIEIFRERIADIIIGTIFLFGGLAACGIAAMSRRSGGRVLVWLGIWSAMYGARPLADSLAVVAHLPRWFQISLPYLDTAIAYSILVVAVLPGLELSRGKLRVFYQAMLFVSLAIGLAGIVFFIFTGSSETFIRYNNLLAACSASVLLTVVAVPALYRKFFLLSDRGVLLVGILVFAVEGVYANVVRPLGLHPSPLWDTLGFAALLLSLAYVAFKNVFANERRLLSIESELAIAREIQTSILPDGSPKIKGLQIRAVYRPMTAVAGDFYEFVPVDQNRTGFLVADVTGHGVPAALIASMIKIAMQSVMPCAHNPREVLRGLNRILFGQLRNRFASAAYLWVDTENHRALYSAAGHPPLLCWRNNALERIESNGLLFGVLPEADYPVCEIPIATGDRLLMYTDGVIEPENRIGDSFGDGRLEQVIRNNQSSSPSQLADQLLAEVRDWQPSSTQQDDITLIVVDVA